MKSIPVVKVISRIHDPKVNDIAANLQHYNIISTATCPNGQNGICGTIAGKVCPAGTECMFKGNYPDASGKCCIKNPKSITGKSLLSQQYFTKIGRSFSNKIQFYEKNLNKVVIFSFSSFVLRITFLFISLFFMIPLLHFYIYRIHKRQLYFDSFICKSI